MSNFKSQAKRKRELAKLDKRQAKDQKRALRKAERAAPVVGGTAPVAQFSPVAVAKAPLKDGRPAVAAPSKPLTFAEAALRWKNTKITKPKTR